MALPPELLELLLEGAGDDYAPRFETPREPVMAPWQMEEAPERDLRFPERQERGGFLQRFGQSYADSPTNFEPGPGTHPLLVALASGMNSGSRVAAVRQQRERELGRQNQEGLTRVNLARIAETGKRRAAQEAETRTLGDRAFRLGLARTVAGLKPQPEAKPTNYDQPQPGESYQQFRARRVREMREDAGAKAKPGGEPTVIQNEDGTFTVVPGGGKMPTSTERDKLTEDESGLAQMGRINQLFKPEFVGPQATGRGVISQFTDRVLREGEADFKAALADFRNKAINRISGAAVSESEAKRMEQQLPNLGNPPESFKSKMRQSEVNLRDLATRRRGIYSRTGVNLSRLAPLPATAESTGGDWFDRNAPRGR